MLQQRKAESAGFRPPDGVHRQRQSPACRGRRRASEGPARARQGRPFQRRRGDGRDPGKRARPRRVRAAVDLLADQRQPDGTAGDGGFAEARLRGPRNRCDPLHGIRAAGPPAEFRAGADHRQGGRQHDVERGRGPRAHHGSALGADPGVLRHPGGQHLLRPDHAGRRVEARLQEPGGGVARRRRRAAGAGAREAAGSRPRHHRQAPAAAQRRHGDEHHRRSREAAPASSSTTWWTPPTRCARRPRR